MRGDTRSSCATLTTSGHPSRGHPYNCRANMAHIRQSRPGWKLSAECCLRHGPVPLHTILFFFFFTLVTGPTRPWSLELSDTSIYEPQIRARLGTTAVERTWHMYDSQGQFLAVSFRSKSLKLLKLFPPRGNSESFRCRANLQQISQSRPDSGLGLSPFAGGSL